MILEIAIALLLGVISGTLTGLAPGIHINLVASFLLASLPKLEFISPLSAAIFITSMSITHTFVDFIPSIFLGAPEEDTFLAVLPGHQMMLRGFGYKATVIAFYGCLTAIPGIMLISIIYSFLLPTLFPLMKSAIPFILIGISSYIILRDKSIPKAALIFLLSGLTGYLLFNSADIFGTEIKEPLLPLLSGLFGISGILYSLKSKTSVPHQKITPLKNVTLGKKSFLKSVMASYISAPLCSFLPGIGSGHSAVIGSEIIKQTRGGFIFLVGSLNTFVMGLSFATLFAINKSRTGSAAAIQELFPNFDLKIFIILLLVITISGLIAFFLSLNLAKLAAKFINFMPYKTINLAVIIVIISVTLIFSGPLGLPVLAITTALGIMCIIFSVRRINLMGCLIIPSILYYLSQYFNT